MKNSDGPYFLGKRIQPICTAGQHKKKDSKGDRAATLEYFDYPEDDEFEPCKRLPVYRIMSVPVAPLILDTLSSGNEELVPVKAMELLDLADAPKIEVSTPISEKPALKKSPNFFSKLAKLFHHESGKHVNFGEMHPEPEPRRTSKFLNLFIPPRSTSHSPTTSVVSSDMSINSEELEVIREKLPMKTTSEELSFSRKYRFVDNKIIGRGASGVVRLGTLKSDPALRVAVKEFRKRRRNETRHQYLMKLTAEYLIGSRLKHPNVISMLDIVHDGKKWFEVMEYCPGGDLFSAIQNSELDIDEIDSAFYQIIQGVAYLHSLGVAHRDLKPENLLMDCSGFVKIADFGVSEVFLLDDPAGPSSSIAIDPEQYCCKKFRLSHGVCGSSPYIAPEEFAQGDYDARAVDVWALGIIYFAMVFHTIPWGVAQMSDEGYRQFIQYGAKGFEPFKRLSYGARTLLKRMLEADPAKRISIEEILQDEWVRAIQICPIRNSSSKRKSRGKHDFHFDSD